ncbi:methyltransferase-like protein 27 isoform X3 [Phaenicophaeus curvirostris]|uniref:methyltransferase-like protein 27 isoform X3 n=1 Tax=Phaenicophaeus curvirostris TaxID=33595 RepID=UPI0037F0CFB8
MAAPLPPALRERVSAVHGAAALPELLRLYDEWAARYEEDVAALQYRAPALAASALAAAVRGPPGAARVLDVGCGTGLVAREGTTMWSSWWGLWARGRCPARPSLSCCASPGPGTLSPARTLAMGGPILSGRRPPVHDDAEQPLQPAVQSKAGGHAGAAGESGSLGEGAGTGGGALGEGHFRGREHPGHRLYLRGGLPLSEMPRSSAPRELRALRRVG